MPRLLNRYAEDKAEKRYVDFDDLLRLATRLMTQDHEAAAAYRWRFRHLVVDEFQDVNPLQYDLLRAWLGDGDDLFVVGDPHQAIYGWNGADARYLDHFDRAFPPERYPGMEVLHLRDNHRSSPQVLAVAAAVLATGRLVPHRPDGPLPEVVEHVDADAEARAVARDVRERHGPGRPWSDQVVLVRTNALAAVVAGALGRAKIPHRLRGADQLLGRPVVVAALHRLRRERYESVLADLRAGEPPERSDDPERDLEDQATLVVLSQEYETFESQPSGPGFAAWLTAALRSGEGDGRHRDAVEVSTFHAAKGLEWPVVHLAGLEDGLVPISYATSEEARDEERRLLYVAVTRAQDEVRFHWSHQRVAPSGEVRDQAPSPWLADVNAAVERLAEAAQPVDGRHHLDRPRADLLARHPVVRTAEDDALSRLEAWRAQAARAGRVTDEAILDDSTLRALAEARPASRAALEAVPGLGPVKLARHGDALLEVLRPVRLVEP
jgi:DNA helicase-2/ATP-dependent DNA helicase PcrA